VPMHVSLPDKSTWFLDAKGVLSFLEMNRARPLARIGGAWRAPAWRERARTEFEMTG